MLSCFLDHRRLKISVSLPVLSGLFIWCCIFVWCFIALLFISGLFWGYRLDLFFLAFGAGSEDVELVRLGDEAVFFDELVLDLFELRAEDLAEIDLAAKIRLG